MKDSAINALRTIAAFPITDPKNQDAINIRAIAVSALAGLKDELVEVKDGPELKTNRETNLLQCIIDVTGLENPEVVKKNWDLESDLGMDNLDKIEFQMLLEEKFEIDIDDSDFVGFQTLQDILTYLDDKLGID